MRHGLSKKKREKMACPGSMTQKKEKKKMDTSMSMKKEREEKKDIYI